MPKPISRRELIRKLKLLGFAGPFPGGKHPFMERDNFKLPIPNQHNGDLKPRLVSIFARELKMKPKDFDNL